MKILPFTASHGSFTADSARMSGQIKPISLDELSQHSHGVVIFGLADDTGVKNVGGRTGARQGPEAFRRKFYRLTTKPLPYPVYDLGDLQPEDSIEATHQCAREAIRAIHAAGHFPLLIGGGHDLAAPEALACLDHLGKSLQIVNLDAHLDLRNSYNGITSGSPWYLVAESPEFRKTNSKLLEIGIQKHCNADELVDYAKKKDIEILWLQDLRANNSKLEKLLTARLKVPRALVSLDIDGVRWSEAPGCSAPQNTGFSAEEAVLMCFAVGNSKSVRSFGIYELSPPLDRDDQTAALVARCAYSFLEGMASRFKVSRRRVQLKGHGEKKGRRVRKRK